MLVPVNWKSAICFVVCIGLALFPLWKHRIRPDKLWQLIRPEAYYSTVLAHNEIRWLRLKEKYQLSKFDALSILVQNNVNKDKTVTYTCESVCGGLGDRLRGIITTYFLALVTDRHFMINMKHPCNLAEFLEPNLHNWTFRNFRISSNRSKRRIVAIDGNNEFLQEFRDTAFPEKWSHYDDIEIQTNLDFVTPVFMNARLRQNLIINVFSRIVSPERANINTMFPLLFEVLFKPSSRVAKLIDPFLTMANERKKAFLCLHLRIGLNPSNPKDFVIKGRSTIANDTINFLKKSEKLQNQSLLLMVISDSSAAVVQVLQHFPNRSYTIPGPILHIDRPADHINRCDGFSKVVGDFFMLGECHTSLLSNSRFSAFANLRRDNPYLNLYKYDSATMQIEHCDNMRFISPWESPRSVNIAIYCPVTRNGSTHEINF